MRYFDKTFFKFTLGFLIIIVVSLLIIYATSAYATGVEKIVFTTDPQTIKPNTLSDPITIQTQDLGSNSFQTSETLDIQFVSSSASGQFLNSSGNSVTTYMSKNTANKTFYYKDSTEGTFTITVNIRGRDSGLELSASQQIIISNSNNQNISGEVLGAMTSSSSPSSSQVSGSSVTNVSSLNSQLEIVAGNDRITSPGSPTWFQVTVKKNTTGTGLELNWSFGDGNVGIGPLVSHTYKYPGDYVVVLSAKAGDIFSVSRFKLKVVESNILVSDKGEYLEITNNSGTEINLFKWKIENKGKGFIFQPNTIILPKSSIKLDKILLTMKGLDNSQETLLKNSLGEEVFASKNIENIKNEALVIQSKIPYTKTTTTKNENKKEEKEIITNNTENIIYEAPKQEGFMTRLTNFIKRVFSK